VLELKKTKIDLASIVQTAVDGARPYFERRHQLLSVEAPDLIFSEADGTRVAQILGNLLHNASKFSADGGRIGLVLERSDERARIRVTDTGVGIPSNQLDRVFEMFARVERSGIRGASDSGLGIGLALSRRLAELHGGTLVVESSGEGQGATFTLTLPTVAPAPAVNAEAAREAAAGTGGLRILVVEDNDDIADTLADLLRDLGHAVSVARSGPEGVAMVEQLGPELVLCDIGLPGMDGNEVCRAVRAMRLGAQPVMVALTGWGREDDRKRTSDAGFDHHLVKPVSAEKLRSVLRARA